MSNNKNLGHLLPIASANRKVMNAHKNNKSCCYPTWKTDTKETLLFNKIIKRSWTDSLSFLADRMRHERTAHFQWEPKEQMGSRTQKSHEFQLKQTWLKNTRTFQMISQKRFHHTAHVISTTLRSIPPFLVGKERVKALQPTIIWPSLGVKNSDIFFQH